MLSKVLYTEEGEMGALLLQGEGRGAISQALTITQIVKKPLTLEGETPVTPKYTRGLLGQNGRGWVLTVWKEVVPQTAWDPISFVPGRGVKRWPGLCCPVKSPLLSPGTLLQVSLPS